MRKIYVFMATAIVALASCTNDTLVNDVTTPKTSGEDGAIAFSTVYKGMTRADYIGADAAGKLGNNFVVYGFKGDGTTQEKVFDHYNVNWVANTANTTTSNTANWEYVGQAIHDHATTTAQSIKYWDYATTQYDFIAYSKGTATAVYDAADYVAGTNVLYTPITPATMTSSTGGAYTVKGRAADLAKVYIADLVTAYRDPVATGDYKKEVDIKFRSLSAKVRVALYETVPGYSVQAGSVKFYTDGSTVDASGVAHLYTTGSDVFNEEGTYTVYYPTTGSGKQSETDYNKAHISFAAETSGTATVKGFGTLDIANKAADKEGTETAGKLYLGRTSSAATYAGVNTTENPNYYTIVIPNETGAQLNLKVDYTLLSTDGSGEVINVTGATAQVPAVYATWKSGYAYTYIFKISQNTNGWTNPDITDAAGLYPITFDATVVETEDGIQETITTVADPSITTYAKGAVVTGNDEYTTGSNIYVMVDNGTALSAANAKLYTVTLEDGAAQTTNEASVANALANGTESPTGTWTVTDANGKKMTVVSAPGLTYPNKIAAEDAPDGNEISPVNCAMFTPSAAGTYAFEYVITAPVAGTPAAYDAVANGTTLTAGNTYYTDDTGGGEFVADGTEVADGTNFFVLTPAVPGTPGVYAYKIIKVQ